MLERLAGERDLTQPAKAGLYERVLAPLLIFLVTIASLAVLAFLGSRTASCVSHISAQVAEEISQAAIYSALPE